MGRIQVETLVLTPMCTNCYIAYNKETGAAFIVDPAGSANAIMNKLDSLGAKPEAILLTHGHFDHIGAVNALREQYQIPVYAYTAEKPVLEDPEINLSVMIGSGFVVKADYFLRDLQTLDLIGTKVQIIHTPGHTTGSACYYLPQEDVLFSGDTLFRCSVGRTDFPTGSAREISESLHGRLYGLPEITIVYPGHESSTDIRYEKNYNPY